MNKTSIKSLIFDYGNTLVEFGIPQTKACDAALAEAVARLYGPLDLDRLRKIRDRNRMAPYAGDPPAYCDNDLRAITRDMIRELYAVDPSPADLEHLVQVRFDVFVNAVEASDGVGALLQRLGARYKLGLLSNYPDGSAIRASLRKVGYDRYFNSVVISGDLGFVKPHPLLFQTIVSDLSVQPSEVLFVGDNWLADVQGAKRAGMQVAHTTQWAPYEHFKRNPGDLEPDLTLERIQDLERYV